MNMERLERAVRKFDEQAGQIQTDRDRDIESFMDRVKSLEHKHEMLSKTFENFKKKAYSVVVELQKQNDMLRQTVKKLE